MKNVQTQVMMDAAEKAELQAAAKDVGVSLSDAMRLGAWLYIAARKLPEPTRRGRPRKETTA